MLAKISLMISVLLVFSSPLLAQGKPTRPSFRAETDMIKPFGPFEWTDGVPDIVTKAKGMAVDSLYIGNRNVAGITDREKLLEISRENILCYTGITAEPISIEGIPFSMNAGTNKTGCIGFDEDFEDSTFLTDITLVSKYPLDKNDQGKVRQLLLNKYKNFKKRSSDTRADAIIRYDRYGNEFSAYLDEGVLNIRYLGRYYGLYLKAYSEEQKKAQEKRALKGKPDMTF